ncbi:MAG: HU family DNA-binding protein [Muribaculaceae bacterium]|nr:HU family DNA-binding protein [Muribaculaceae bacterium]
MDNKTIVENISRELNLKKDEVKKLMTTFCSQLADSCINGDVFVAPGFGQFEPRKKSERLATHPSSGKRLLIPPKLTICFKPSAILKSRIQK